MTTAAAIPGELNPGLRSTFEAAGFAEVARPTPRWAVMRIEFPNGCPTAG